MKIFPLYENIFYKTSTGPNPLRTRFDKIGKIAIALDLKFVLKLNILYYLKELMLRKQVH